MRLSTLTIADRFLRKKALELLDRVLQQRHARNNPPLQVESIHLSDVGGNGKQNTTADGLLVLCSRIPVLSRVDSDTSTSFMPGHHGCHALTCACLLQGLSVSGWYEYELSCERVQELLLSAPLARLQHLSIGVDAEQVRGHPRAKELPVTTDSHSPLALAALYVVDRQKYVPAVVSYLERGAPLLESLQITCRDPWQRKDTDFLLDWSPVAVELAQGKAPSLTSLSIRGMDLHDHDACIR